MFHAIIQRRSVATGETRCHRGHQEFETSAHADKYVLDMDSFYPGYIHTWQQVDPGVMTAAQAVARLNNLVSGDNEAAHADADDILCIVLRAAGPEYAAVADAYKAANDRIGFWYA